MNLYKFWFGGKGWKALWVAVRRAPRDAHARRNVLRLLASCIPFFAYVGWYVFFIHGAVSDLGLAGVIAMACGAALTLGIAFFMVIRQKLEDRAFERDNPSVSVETKLELYRETCLLATLLERLASEIGMEKELPDNIEVITRRVLLDRLAKLNLRDDLDPWLLDVLLVPDGHWAASLKQRAINAWEHFVVLRWALGLGELRGLTEEPKYTLSEARSLFDVKHPDKLPVLPSWDIRPARNSAIVFFNRCWSELIARGQWRDSTEEQIANAIHARESIQAEGYTADFLIGARTVPEWPEPLLWHAIVRSYHRQEMLSLLVDVACGEKPAREIRTLFSGFFSPEPDGAAERAESEN